MTGISSVTGASIPLELISDTEVRELRCIRLFTEDGTEHLIRITDGMTPALFRERFDALGIKQFEKALISASPNEREWVLSLFESFTFQSIDNWASPPEGVSYGPSTIKIQVTERYFRDIAKIGFHYFLTKATQFVGNESCFEEIRKFIIEPSSPEDCNRFITRSDDATIWGLEQGARINSWGHILSAEVDYYNLIARVHLFAGPMNRPLIYTVLLGKNPSSIIYRSNEADFFVYFPSKDRGTYIGEVVPLISVP
jgi:hypothetical protein